LGKHPDIADGHLATSSTRSEPSTHRHDDFPFGASGLEIAQHLGNVCKWIGLSITTFIFSVSINSAS
jgi:hypothetical protein